MPVTASLHSRASLHSYLFRTIFGMLGTSTVELMEALQANYEKVRWTNSIQRVRQSLRFFSPPAQEV
jgi:hypothetical protein